MRFALWLTTFYMVQHRSLAAFRKLQIAFRAAAHMNEEDTELAWTIDNADGESSLFDLEPAK